MEMRPSAKAFKKKVNDKPVIMLEAGIYRGYNSKELFRNFNCDELYLIDKWYTSYENGKYKVPEMLDYAKTAMSFFDGCDNVIIIKADSVLFKLFKDNYFDYIYLDDDHSYEHCKKEFEKYWHYLKPGGMISGDNLEAPGVRLALDEFCAKYNLKFEQEPWKVHKDTGKPIASDWWIWKEDLKTIFINGNEYRVDGDEITAQQILTLHLNDEYSKVEEYYEIIGKYLSNEINDRSLHGLKAAMPIKNDMAIIVKERG